ncbi:MAG: DUF1080 domain-containing protein, partial [Planctomycetota bacterium]
MHRRPTRIILLTGLCLVTWIALANVAVAGDGEGLTSARQAAGWVVLFDGSSTDAWRGYRKSGFPEQGWSVESDGSLHVAAGGG